MLVSSASSSRSIPVYWGSLPFQVFLAGRWQQYDEVTDRILKRAFESDRPTCRVELKGSNYVVDFRTMIQTSEQGRARPIRHPSIENKQVPVPPATPPNIEQEQAPFLSAPPRAAAASRDNDVTKTTGDNSAAVAASSDKLHHVLRMLREKTCMVRGCRRKNFEYQYRKSLAGHIRKAHKGHGVFVEKALQLIKSEEKVRKQMIARTDDDEGACIRPPPGLPRLGTRLSVRWPQEQEETKTWFTGRIVRVQEAPSRRHPERGAFKYEIAFEDGELLETRLEHLEWHALRDPMMI